MREDQKEKSNMFSSEHIQNEVLTFTDQLQATLDYFYSKQQAMKKYEAIDTSYDQRSYKKQKLLIDSLANELIFSRKNWIKEVKK